MSAWLEAEFASHRPRALAALTRLFRDIDLAEEAFAEACLKAVADWPRNGTPRTPFAWLLTVARNAARDRLRTSSRRQALLQRDAAALGEEMTDTMPDPDELRDDVLRLMFICCHPALSTQDQLALALKVVAGLSVPEIARAFLIRPRTLEQRLTRAKRTVARNPVPFETPSLQERARRLGEVSLMVYVMFNEGWSSTGPGAQIRVSLCEEAIRLARLLAELFPGMSEQSGLLALLLFQHARRAARTDDAGRLVTLEDQDRSLWDRAATAEAISLLQKAERAVPRGPFTVQAAIAAQHALARTAEQTDWQQIEALYAALYAIQPTPVVRLNQIAAMSRTGGPRLALDALDALGDALVDYRWFHTMRGAFLSDLGETAAARAAYETALSLGPTAPERAAIAEKIAACEKTS